MDSEVERSQEFSGRQSESNDFHCERGGNPMVTVYSGFLLTGVLDEKYRRSGSAFLLLHFSNQTCLACCLLILNDALLKENYAYVVNISL